KGRHWSTPAGAFSATGILASVNRLRQLLRRACSHSLPPPSSPLQSQSCALPLPAAEVGLETALRFEENPPQPLAQAHLEQGPKLVMICTAAVSRRPDLSWPVRVLVGLAATATLVTALYFFIDQPVILFFRGCDLGRYAFLKWLTRPPEAFVILSP